MDRHSSIFAAASVTKIKMFLQPWHQIAQTVAKSSLAKMSDDETRTVTDGQFYTTKEFVNYMTSATTEVGSEITSSAFIFKRSSFGDYRCCFCR
jgi:hypothetical protein